MPTQNDVEDDNSNTENDPYRLIARYKLNDGRLISLKRKDSPPTSTTPSRASSTTSVPKPIARTPSAALEQQQQRQQKEEKEEEKRPSLPPRISRQSSGSQATAQGPSPRRPSLPSRAGSMSNAQNPVSPRRSVSGPKPKSASRPGGSGAEEVQVSDAVRERPPKLPPRPGMGSKKSSSSAGAQSPASKRPSLSESERKASEAGSKRGSGLSKAMSESQWVGGKRPSLSGRETVGDPGKVSRRPSGMSQPMSEIREGDAKRPSLSSRATSDAADTLSKTPSGISRKTSQAQPSRPKGPNTSERPTSDASETPSRKLSGVRRSASQAQESFPERPNLPNRATPEVEASASRRPSGVSRKTSQAQESDAERPSLSSHSTSDEPDKASGRPSKPSRSTSQAQESAPKRSSLVSDKSSRSGASRPKLSSTPSGRRVSFQDDEMTPPETKNEASKLPDISEDVPSRPQPAMRTSSIDSQAPAERKAIRKTTPSNKGDVKPSEEPKSQDRPDREKPKLPHRPSKRESAAQKPDGSNKSEDPTHDNQNETLAHRLAEEDQGLNSVLTEDQCADLTLLIAAITKRMREDIESHYDPSKGLKLIKDSNGGDALENIDFDPGTVDVTAYDKERKIREEQEKELAKPHTKKLKEANLKWFDEWREIVILRVGEAVNSKEKAVNQREDAKPQTTKARPQQVQKINAGAATNANAGPKLEDLFPRVKTLLTKLPMAKRVLVLHSVMLLLLSLEHYNAASRVLLLYLTTSLKIGLNSLRGEEEKTAQGLLKAVKQMSADAEASKRLEESNNASRKWKIRLASAAGAAVIGYTGGLAAPMIAAGVGSVMGELGLGTTAAAGYLGSVAGNTAVVGSLFGAYGGRMTGQVMSNISAGVQDFAFLPIHGERKEHEDSVDAATNTRRLRVIVAISGWLLEKEEVVTPWRVLKPSAEVFALRFELEALLNLGQSFDTMLQSTVYGYAQSAMVKRTVFAELMNGMMWPMALTKVARVVDNPFSLAQTRADKAGQVLADALINHVQGERPVTLVGYSLGARVIWSCLTSLAKQKAFGLVESAVLMGSPIASDTSTWRSMRAAVSGRLVNVYSENDYLLAFLYRTSSLQYGVAGLVPITGLAGVENVNVTETVSGHLRYRYLVGSILQKIRFEDVDKEEVAKEAKAFETIVEEEKKRTYLQQAGELYENYKGKKPEPKKSHKKQVDISDGDAEKQTSAMEQTIADRTKKRLMQWAVEQLYLTRPSADKAKAKAAEVKNRDGIDGKSYYQWAKEATYLSRSGGPEAKDAAKDKQEQAQEAATPASKPGYLSSAAGYIPKGYVPSLRSSGKGKEGKKADQNMSKEDSEGLAKGGASSGYSSYLPSFGSRGSSLKRKGKEKEKDESPAERGKETVEGQGKAEGRENAEEGQEKVEEEQGKAEEGREGDTERAQGEAEEAQSSQPSQAENTPQSITSDTEGGDVTDEDPFTSPPAKGENKFADAAKASEGS